MLFKGQSRTFIVLLLPALFSRDRVVHSLYVDCPPSLRAFSRDKVVDDGNEYIRADELQPQEPVAAAVARHEKRVDDREHEDKDAKGAEEERHGAVDHREPADEDHHWQHENGNLR